MFLFPEMTSLYFLCTHYISVFPTGNNKIPESEDFMKEGGLLRSKS